MSALTPGSGFAEVLAGARMDRAGLAAFARGELGWHFAPAGSAFAFGDATLATTGQAWQAGIGARITW